jgi:hypothetical protein
MRQQNEINPPIAAARVARRLDLTTLQLFIAVCEERNLTRASEREAIAPSRGRTLRSSGHRLFPASSARRCQA